MNKYKLMSSVENNLFLSLSVCVLVSFFYQQGLRFFCPAGGKKVNCVTLH